MRTLLAVVLLAVTSGCAYFPDSTDRAAIAAGRLVKKYCEVFNLEDRELFGDKVRAEAAPDSVRVDCAP